MPKLDITCCEDCPFVHVWNKPGLDDSYSVTCLHGDMNRPSIEHKMKFARRVYFECPLNKEPQESSI